MQTLVPAVLYPHGLVMPVFDITQVEVLVNRQALSLIK